MDRLSPVSQFKSEALASGEFSGYASTFGGAPDAYGDVILPGAFAASMQEHRSKGSMPALLWAHDGREPIGRWLSLKEDAHGLHGRGKLTLGTVRGGEAHALMHDDAVGLSIGFRAKAWKPGSNGTQLLTEIELVEVSVVALPANPNAKITDVKAKPMTIRDYEAALHESLGFSVREAKSLALRGWRSPVDQSEELEAIHAAVRAAIIDFKGD